MNPVTGFCSIKSPIYSVNTNKFCITVLFMKNAELMGSFCQITVKMKTILPIAEYLSDGYWVITTIGNFRFSIVCQNSSTFLIDIKPPFQVIKLDMLCHAVSKMLILPAYFHKESKYNINDPFDKLLRNSGHFNFNLWKSCHENVPNYTMSNFATHFPIIEEIQMGHLIDKLNNLRQVENPDNLPSWIYSIANLGIIIFVIVLVIICYVFLLCIMSCCFLLVLFM
jgi:hypothetical protein